MRAVTIKICVYLCRLRTPLRSPVLRYFSYTLFRSYSWLKNRPRSCRPLTLCHSWLQNLCRNRPLTLCHSWLQNLCPNLPLTLCHSWLQNMCRNRPLTLCQQKMGFPQRKPQFRAGPCNAFSATGRCRKPLCPYKHACPSCGGNHSKSQCQTKQMLHPVTKPTNTGYRK